MARGRRAAAREKDPDQTTDVNGVPKKDFDGAKRTYYADIKPAVSRAREEMQAASTGYKHIKKGCNINRGAAKMAFQLAEMEEEKQQDWLRSFKGMLETLKIGLEIDLVDNMEGDNSGTNVVPLKKPVAEELITTEGDD